MGALVTGIHHITAIASDAQRNVDFYAGVLGLKLVKKTVNFDDPDVYHFYFGDPTGSPGSLLTCFPYAGLAQGRKGKGMATVTAFAVPDISFAFWKDRLRRYRISFREVEERFGEERSLYLEDDDGLGLELVFTGDSKDVGPVSGATLAQHAIRGVHHVELMEEGFESTARLLTDLLGYRLVAEKGNRFRFASAEEARAFIEVVCAPGSLKGLRGSGTFHHVAFATTDLSSQKTIRERAVAEGFNVTPVLDRKYFSSCYFREPGGVLLEVATAGPGLTIDEAPSRLGEKLMLPADLENRREALEKKLPDVQFDNGKFT